MKKHGFKHMLRDGRQIPDCVLDDAYLASRRDLTPQVIETSRCDSTPRVIETSRCDSTPQVVETRRHPSRCRFTRIAAIAFLQVSIVAAIAAITFGTQAAFRILAASGVNGIAEFGGSAARADVVFVESAALLVYHVDDEVTLARTFLISSDCQMRFWNVLLKCTKSLKLRLFGQIR